MAVCSSTERQGRLGGGCSLQKNSPAPVWQRQRTGRWLSPRSRSRSVHTAAAQSLVLGPLMSHMHVPPLKMRRRWPLRAACYIRAIDCCCTTALHKQTIHSKLVSSSYSNTQRNLHMQPHLGVRHLGGLLPAMQQPQIPLHTLPQLCYRLHLHSDSINVNSKHGLEDAFRQWCRSALLGSMPCMRASLLNWRSLHAPSY